MSENTKGNITFIAFVLGIGFGFWSLMFWVLNWTWWIALPLAAVSGLVGTIFICVLPFIIWGIVGD